MKTNGNDSSWIKISHGDNAGSLRGEIERLKKVWPGRYRYAIVPQVRRRRKSYDLYLKHC